ncbi:MAG: hypothetical protein ACLTZV_10140 [Oscillospiraceae bacterium]
MILDAVGVELILTGGTDTGVGCNAQLARDDLIVRWNHNDALLFQRKVSAGLLFCHVLTSSQQHTLLQYLQNSYDQNGEKSSVKCEICTKLGSDPPRNLFDLILRKTNRSERLQKLADA